MTKAFTLIVLFLFCAFPAPAHAAEAEEKRTPASPYVGKINFSGNKAISEEELRLIIGTSEKRSFLGLGLFGGSGKPFNPQEFEKDIFLIKKLYTYKGFFFADVDTTIARKSSAKKLNINIKIRENEPSKVDFVTYEGLEKIPAALKTDYLNKKRLKVNDIFSVERLIDERDRTISFFREYGFAFFHQDSIRIKVDTVGTHAGVLYQLKLPKQLQYGPINAVVHNPVKSDTNPKEKTFTQDNISGKILGNQKILPRLITSSIEFRPGNVTRLSLEQRTLQNFGATNLFSSIYISPDSVSADKIYTTIHLETAPKHQIEPKILVDNRYGSLFFGGSLAYENKNLFGGAEQFRTTTEYGAQTGYNDTLLQNLNTDQYAKVIPYEFSFKNSLILPVLKKPGNFYATTLEYSTAQLPVLLANKNGLIRATYSARLNPSSRLNFDFFEFEWVKKDSLKGFKQLFKTDLANNIGINPADEAAINAGIDSLLETHVNQSFRLRYNTTNRPIVASDKTIWNLDLLAEESGSLAWLIDNYLDTKSRSGFTDKDPQIFGTTYSQYVKLETGLILSKNFSPRSQLAGRGKIGWMMPYGKAETTPEERRFYAGGTNSMRGWLFNTLGPGRNANEVAANFGADIKLELNIEYRQKFFTFFNQPSGITFFSDIGNIWDRTGPYAFNLKSLTRDFAWDAGVGLRIGSPIGPFRFDFAYKLHDPAQAKPWRISNLNIGDYTFSFGIGEAF